MIPGAVVRAGRPRLLRGEQPPVRGLPAVAQLELDGSLQQRVELAERERRILPADNGDQLGRILAAGRSGELREHRLQRLTRLAPCEHLILQEADRLAGM